MARWSGEQLRYFISGFLGPTFVKERISNSVMIFLACIPVDNYEEYVAPALNDLHTMRYLKGVGLQYSGVNMMPKIRAKAPDLRMWETETPCGNGTHDWNYA